MSCLILVFNFGIRDGCLTLRAPVDYSFTAVDKALVVELYENFLDSLVAAFIHCETFS